MLVRTKFPAGWALDAITIWPCIFIRPERAADAGLVAHETVHLREQARWLVLPWLIAYGCSRKFRRGAEIRGYRAQIAAGGITRRRAAELLAGEYGLGMTIEQIDKLLMPEE